MHHISREDTSLDQRQNDEGIEGIEGIKGPLRGLEHTGSHSPEDMVQKTPVTNILLRLLNEYKHLLVPDAHWICNQYGVRFEYLLCMMYKKLTPVEVTAVWLH